MVLALVQGCFLMEWLKKYSDNAKPDQRRSDLDTLSEKPGTVMLANMKEISAMGERCITD
jgi:hypothetical protein